MWSYNITRVDSSCVSGRFCLSKERKTNSAFAQYRLFHEEHGGSVSTGPAVSYKLNKKMTFDLASLLSRFLIRKFQSCHPIPGCHRYPIPGCHYYTIPGCHCHPRPGCHCYPRPGCHCHTIPGCHCFPIPGCHCYPTSIPGSRCDCCSLHADVTAVPGARPVVLVSVSFYARFSYARLYAQSRPLCSFRLLLKNQAKYTCFCS